MVGNEDAGLLVPGALLLHQDPQQGAHRSEHHPESLLRSPKVDPRKDGRGNRRRGDVLGRRQATRKAWAPRTRRATASRAPKGAYRQSSVRTPGLWGNLGPVEFQWHLFSSEALD